MNRRNQKMLPKIFSWGSLGLVVVPCLLSFLGVVDLALVQWLALLGTIGWFISTPLWMRHTADDKTDGANI